MRFVQRQKKRSFYAAHKAQLSILKLEREKEEKEREKLDNLNKQNWLFFHFTYSTTFCLAWVVVVHWQQTKVGTQASAGKCNVGTPFFLPTPRHYFPLVFQLTLINSPCRVGWLAGWLHVIVRRQTSKKHTQTLPPMKTSESAAAAEKKFTFRQCFCCCSVAAVLIFPQNDTGQKQQ